MPKWIPEQKWQGEDVFIIGGGLSLKDFDWNLLKDELTIGCNDAFLLGEEICKICVFGDVSWFNIWQEQLSKFKNPVFTNHDKYAKTKMSWVWWLPRAVTGLHKNALGWNKNTGSVAINLALILGAKRVYLLGFDMKLLEASKKLSKRNKNNWHINKVGDPNPEAIQQQLEAFNCIPKSLKSVFPGSEIINITDDSALDVFPKIGVKEFWGKRKAI